MMGATWGWMDQCKISRLGLEWLVRSIAHASNAKGNLWNVERAVLKIKHHTTFELYWSVWLHSSPKSRYLFSHIEIHFHVFVFTGMNLCHLLAKNHNGALFTMLYISNVSSMFSLQHLALSMQLALSMRTSSWTVWRKIKSHLRSSNVVFALSLKRLLLYLWYLVQFNSIQFHFIYIAP